MVIGLYGRGLAEVKKDVMDGGVDIDQFDLKGGVHNAAKGK